MGLWSKLFGLLKTKPRAHIDSSNNNKLPTGRTFQQQIEHDYQQAVENIQSSSNPKFHRTLKEENLAINFSFRHSSTLEALESAVYKETNKVFNIWSIDDRIEQCKKAIVAYDKLKKFCLSKGKGGSLHFEDIWEHCHNRKNPDYRYIEQVEQELHYLKNNYEEASMKLLEEKVKKERKKRIKEFKKTSENVLLMFIEKNKGILQKDLYKQFNPEYKTTINNSLKKLQESGNIIRVKEGNTYKLFLNNHDHPVV